MPKYLSEASYSTQGAQGLISKGGGSRRSAVADMAACALGVNAAERATVKTIELLTPEQVDAAAKRSAGYRPPGG
jgi:hypothetical protein